MLGYAEQKCTSIPELYPRWPESSLLTGRVPAQLEKMQLIPTRSFDPNIIQASAWSLPQQSIGRIAICRAACSVHSLRLACYSSVTAASCAIFALLGRAPQVL